LEATSFRSTKRRSLAEQQLVLRRKQQRPETRSVSSEASRVKVTPLNSTQPRIPIRVSRVTSAFGSGLRSRCASAPPSRWLDSSSELEAPRPFGVAVPTGPGARRFLLPSAGLAGSSGLEASRSFGVEGLKASRVVESDAQSELRRSIFVAVAFGWRWWRPDGGCARLTLASSLLRQGSSDPRLRGRLLVQPKWIEVETTRLDLGFGNGTEDEATATRA
jgi:hypothetical protein